MITNRTDYAIRALVHLAKFGSTTAKKIAEAEKIPPKFLPQIMTQLNQLGYVDCSRGYRGGVRLHKGTEKLSLFSVLYLLEPGIFAFPPGLYSALYSVLFEARESFYRKLRKVTIRDLAKSGDK